MLSRWFSPKPQLSVPRLSVIVNFYNMRREAERTLFTLSENYQRGVSAKDYEVIAVDNGSPQALDAAQVQRFGQHYRYHFFPATGPSPCAAINAAVKQARAPLIMCCIDGARMLSPGILHYALAVAKLFPHPFVYTVSMHLGHTLQNHAVLEGYNQQYEDTLLAEVDWRGDGYELFRISCLAGSANHGFFGTKGETNCFIMKKTDYLALGGYDEAFQLEGGGLCNLDLFNRIHADKRFQPVLLLGEATFHQFHGGVATNVPVAEHPWSRMAAEYQQIRGTAYEIGYRRPVYWGSIGTAFETAMEINTSPR